MAFVFEEEPTKEPAGFVFESAPVESETYNPAEGMSTAEKLAAGAGKSIYDLGRGIRQLGAEAGSMVGLVDDSTVTRLRKQEEQQRQADAPLMATGAGKVGYIGGAVATIPMAGSLLRGLGAVGQAAGATRAGQATQAAGRAVMAPTGFRQAATVGGAMGAMQPVTQEESRLGNVALGAGAGMAGEAIGRGLGRIVRPVRPQLTQAETRVAAEAQRLGVPLTIAQQTGSRPLKIAESVLESHPVTAGTQQAAKQAQRNQYNAAVARTIGQQADEITPEVMETARRQIGGEFDRLSANVDAPVDDTFFTRLAGVERDLTDNIPIKDQSPRLRALINEAVDLIDSGRMDGRFFQETRSALGKLAKNIANDPNRQYKGELLDTIDNFTGLIDDYAGQSMQAGDREAWNQARLQWRNLKTIEKAVDTTSGNVSPAKLATATKKANQSGYMYGRGESDLDALGRVGSAFIKDQIADSGTAGRQMAERVMTLGGGVPLGIGVMDPTAGIATGAAYLGGPLLAQKLMQSPLGRLYLESGLMGVIPRGQQLQQGLSPLLPAARAARTMTPAAYILNSEQQ